MAGSIQSITTQAEAAMDPQAVTEVAIYRCLNPLTGEHFFTRSESERNNLVRVGWTDEGMAWKAPSFSKTPVYRLCHPRTGDHHFTASAGERNVLKRAGWRDEGVAWYSDDAKKFPIYRAFNPKARIGSHHFTATKGEYDSIARKGWRREGVAFYASSRPAAPANAFVYRLYNLWTGEHFYTVSAQEKTVLVNRNWLYEGIGWIAPAKSGVPVYRLCNPKSGLHHFTASAGERNALKRAGWRDEGVAWYSLESGGYPIYRSFHSQGRPGVHNLSSNKAEYDSLARSGWRSEGVTCRAVGPGLSMAPQYKPAHWIALIDHAATSSGITVTGGSITQSQRNALNGYLNSGSFVSFVGLNTKTGKVVCRNADAWHYSASTIKAPYVAALCKYNAPGIWGRKPQFYNICTYSDNDAYAALRSAYGPGYLDRICTESNVSLKGKERGYYSMFSARDLAKLWATVDAYLVSNGPNSALFRESFGKGSICKEGWMFGGTYGRVYNISGVQGDVVYAVMSNCPPFDKRIQGLRDSLVRFLS